MRLVPVESVSLNHLNEASVPGTPRAIWRVFDLVSLIHLAGQASRSDHPSATDIQVEYLRSPTLDAIVSVIAEFQAPQQAATFTRPLLDQLQLI